MTKQSFLIERQAARIAELEAALTGKGKPKKTSSNSHIPPSADGPGRPDPKRREKRPRPSRPGASRPLAEAPDKMDRRLVAACPHCWVDVSGAGARCPDRHCPNE